MDMTTNEMLRNEYLALAVKQAQLLKIKAQAELLLAAIKACKPVVDSK